MLSQKTAGKNENGLMIYQTVPLHTPPPHNYLASLYIFCQFEIWTFLSVIFSDEFGFLKEAIFFFFLN